MGFSLGVIGAGNMAGAILTGALEQKVFPAERVFLSNPHVEKAERFARLGVHTTADNTVSARSGDIVLLAVKPQKIEGVLDEIAPFVAGKCVVSIAAGMSRRYLSSRLPGAWVVCVMPNTPLLLGVGACALTPRENVPEELYQAVTALFASAGMVRTVAAEKMNEIIPVNGSSPAFFFRMADAMVKSAQKQGIDGETALALAAKTMEGAARMLLESGKTAGELTQQVCSPGGTTLAALTAFDELGFEQVIDEAFTRCIHRAYELGK